MFIEFNPNELEKWNDLSEEQKARLIDADEVQLVIDIDIKIENHKKISEEHKYYQVFTYGNCKLINDIVVSKITEKETLLYINMGNGNDEPTSLLVKNNEQKSIQIGNKSSSSIYNIYIHNVKFGRVLEL